MLEEICWLDYLNNNQQIQYGIADVGVKKLSKWIEKIQRKCAKAVKKIKLIEDKSIYDAGVKLKRLVLIQNHITSHGAKYIAKIISSTHKTLIRLDLSGNDIGISGCEFISNALLSRDVEEMKSSTSYFSLSTLCLDYNKIFDGGCKLLSAGLRNTNITSLSLKFNGISKDGAKAIADLLSNSKKLSFINLSNNSIGDEGCEAIAKAMSLCFQNETIGYDSATFRPTSNEFENIQEDRFTLLLENNCIKERGGVAIGEMLKCYNNFRIRKSKFLLELSLFCNELNEIGMLAILDGLICNPMSIVVMNLNLSFNNYYLYNHNNVYIMEKIGIALCQLLIIHPRIFKLEIKYYSALATKDKMTTKTLKRMEKVICDLNDTMYDFTSDFPFPIETKEKISNKLKLNSNSKVNHTSQYENDDDLRANEIIVQINGANFKNQVCQCNNKTTNLICEFISQQQFNQLMDLFK